MPEPARSVAVVVLRADTPDLLVLGHVDGSPAHLPADVIRADETPEAAAARVLLEATGVRGLMPRLAGVIDESLGADAARRWVFLFDAPAGLGEQWPASCVCGKPGRCRWDVLDTDALAPEHRPWRETVRTIMDIES